MQILVAAIASVGLFLGMLGAQEAGRRMAERRRRAGTATGAGTGAIDAAVFALLGLLIAFTFSGAAGRFDAKRQLIVEETNDIGTAYLRVDLLPPERQPALREHFRQYLDARLAIYHKIPDLEAAKQELERASDLQSLIWKEAVTATQAPGAPPSAALLMVPALNAMFDIATTRTMAVRMHPPTIIFGMLFGVAVAAALLAGFAMSGGSEREWLHMAVFAAAMALSVYVILDLEFPRLGLIRINDFDEALLALRATMK